MKSRNIKDTIMNVLTYISSFISCFILIALVVFVCVKGSKNLSFKMLVSDYYETPYFAKVESSESYSFLDKTSKEGIYYSSHYGIGLKDSYDLERNKVVEIVYIDNLSPLKSAKNDEGKVEIKKGEIVKRIQVKNVDGEIEIVTSSYGAEEMVKVLDTSYTINEIFIVSRGGGIRGSLVSTIYLILLTLVVVIPLGIIASIYLALYAKKNKITSILRSLIDMISGIPSIIFGLISMIVFIPFVNSITKNSGGSILAGALTLTIMLLPTVIRTTEEAINNIPKSYKSASLALGASEAQTTFKIILPNALPGILTSCILCIGRIIGESAALIFALGTSIQDDINITKGSTSLAVHIWSVMGGENPNYGQACAISIIILLMVLILNLLVKLVSKKFNKLEVKK